MNGFIGFDRFIIFYTALASSFYFTPFFIYLANKYKIFDKPQSQKIHTSPTPRIGGVAIFLSYILAVMVGIYIHCNWSPPPLIWLFLTVAMVFGVGLTDDFININPRLKLALVTISGLFLIPAFHFPYPWWVLVPTYLIMILWLDYLSNALNLLDGMDGLCSGVVFWTSIILFMMGMRTGNMFFSDMSLILIGSMFGFLHYNLPPARIFLGDGGSYFVGAVLAIISIGILGDISWKIISILWVLGVPVLDTSAVLLRRVFSGGQIFSGDLNHSYNILLSREKNIFMVLSFFDFLAIVLGGLGFLLFFSAPFLQAVSLIIPIFVLLYYFKFSAYFKK